MQQIKTPPTDPRETHIRSLLARALDAAPAALGSSTNLADQGLRGLALVRLLRMLVQDYGRVPPASLLGSTLTLEALTEWAKRGAPGDDGPVPVERLVADTALPEDIRPPVGESAADEGMVLVTGATGFVGPHLLEQLFADPRRHVICLVRAGDDALARRRLIDHLQQQGRWQSAWFRRLEVFAGDTTRPQMGLADAVYERLGKAVDAVYHVAADINWSKPYGKLYETNVYATETLLRFAAHRRAKRFAFLSSIVVCHSLNSTRTITETDDVTRQLHGLYVGYAQSKWVAEQLVREAGERGLPTVIHRPPFVAGDTHLGVANSDDLPARLLSACIEAGMAPDMEWPMDVCPVDFLAQAVVRLNETASPATPTYHLLSHRQTEWRQLLLCLKLYGYRLRPAEYEPWRESVVQASRQRGHPLRPLKALFTNRPDGPESPTMAELLQRPRMSRVCNAATRETLRLAGLRAPEVRPTLVKRYIEHFVDAGLFPPPGRRDRGSPSAEAMIDAAVKACEAHCGAHVTATHQSPPTTGGDSIVTDLSALVQGEPAGLYPVRLTFTFGDGNTAERDAVVKVKASDTTTLAVAREIAALQDPALAAEYDRVQSLLPLNRCHVREPALYQLLEGNVARHTPRYYGHTIGPAQCGSAIVMEGLQDAVRLGGADVLDAAALTGAMECLAAIHGQWLGRTGALSQADWLPPRPTPSERLAMGGFWERLGELAMAYTEAMDTHALTRAYDQLLSSRGQWVADDDGLPTTLIHNDFNPRNLAFRQDTQSAGGVRCLAYDWELATIGLPQRDLAELLCFGQSPEALTPAAVAHYLEAHRRRLEGASGLSLDQNAWRQGFRHVVRELLVERLALYVLIDTVDRQPFLPRVMRSWLAVYTAVETDR